MVEIIVDHREKGLKELIEADEHLSFPYTYMNLEHGDVHVKKGDVVFVFERKALPDLQASIHDGRYHNQKIRLMESYPRERLCYIIEGILDFTHTDAPIVSAVINTMMRDRIAVFNTRNTSDTYAFVLEFAKRIDTDVERYTMFGGACQHMVPPHPKKHESTFVNMLCQVQGVSLKTAKSIEHMYTSLGAMLEKYKDMTDAEKLNTLKSIMTCDTKGSQRKISSTAAKNLYNAIFLT